MKISLKDYFFNQPLKFSQTRFNELDLLRFTAALMVLLYHFTASGTGNTVYDDRYNLIATTTLFPWLTPATKFGFLGVNLFFLISGYIIFISAFSKNAIDFAANRAIRLFPTYWLSILLSLAVLYFYLGFGFHLPIKDILINFTMLQSYLGADHIDPVYWTLVLELHFYFLVFVLILFNQLKAWRFWTSLWLTASWSAALIPSFSFLSYIFEYQYAGYFIAGIVFSGCANKGFDYWSMLMLIMSFALCIFFLPEQIELYNFGHTDTLTNGVGTVLVSSFFLAFYLMTKKILRPPNYAWLTTLGLMTYPLYLIHHQLGRYFIDRHIETLGSFGSFAIATTLSLGLAGIFVLILDFRLNPLLRSYYRSIRQSIKRS